MNIEDIDDAVIRGQEALNLLNSTLFVDVLANYRLSQLEKLVKADPNDTTQIIQLQSTISVIDDLRDELEGFVTNAKDLSSEKQSYV